MKWLQPGCVVLLFLSFTFLLMPYSGLHCLELTINGNFEQPPPAGWTEQIAASNYLIERSAFYDPDPDTEQYLYLGTGGGFLELYQTMLIPSPDIEFSATAKLFAFDDSPGAWAGAAVIVSYLDRDEGTLGKTYIASRSSQCPWEGTSTTHVIEVNDSLWHSYAFNISDELENLPGVDPQKIKRIRIALHNEAHHC